ncbi:helix-turn-helix domain-containing protein [Clostridium sp. UBA4548]|uniref:helix-turn-helix domain-containing protein n=1 Tax=Clostridium sp. UBA4548 TaxID=1946361 RepID=UPI0025C4984C|nr:helix-turn-helix domain-containing protein [Clostridium sp. UBA4548]
MRREYVNYPSNIPVTVSYVNLKEYPIHWHYAIEIIYVLKGTLEVYINSGKYEIHQGQLEIINVDEVHHLHSNENNKILIFHIDPYFFEKYYSDIKNMFFYTKSSSLHSQSSEEYDELRTYLSRILCEVVQKQEDYDEEIEDLLVKLLYHLINNFNYLIYEKEELKDDANQLQRYHSISKYIFNNYNNNITLKDIANNEFLSPQYLSHEIKYATGYSFTDLINLTRVEESIKLLLDTDKTISEISEEVGFSHTRYFNKNFKLHYKVTPLQFRKKYKTNEVQLEKLKSSEILDLNESITYLSYFLEDYDRFNYEDKIFQINIDMSKNLGNFDKSFKNTITIGDAFELLIEDNKDTLEEIQHEIGFQYARILNVFTADMAIFPNSRFYNWNRTKDVLEFLYSINLNPLIVIDSNDFTEDNFIEVIESFLSYFSDLDSVDFRSFKFELSSSLPESVKLKIQELFMNIHNLEIETPYPMDKTSEINPIYDTGYMLPYVIHNILTNNNSLSFLRPFDVLDKQVDLTNEVFFGYPGLINDKGIKKPSYYGYYLLNKLGDTVVAQEDGYIVTKTDDEYQILLYNFHKDIDKLIPLEKFSKLRGVKNATSKKLSLNIINTCSDIKITSYEISEKQGSSFNYWLQMGKPKRLSKEEKEILYKASFPQIRFKHFKKSAVINLQGLLNSYGSILILIKKVQNHH